MHEASLCEAASFVTLTYDQEHLPYGADLVYPHFQGFMKRLRARLGTRVRFFMCGEYGERLHRPHYHAILFGVAFGDRTPWRKSSAGFQLYRSSFLESLWTFGGAEIGDVSLESAAYVARYCMKKITGEAAQSHYLRLVSDTGELINVTPEFARMSLKPGIGSAWLDKYQGDVFPQDEVIMDGRAHKPPRYYSSRYEGVDPDAFELLRSRRLLRALACKSDSTPERLAVRAVCARARLSFKGRSLE